MTNPHSPEAGDAAPPAEAYTSRLSGFHHLSGPQRLERIAALAGLSPSEQRILLACGPEALQRADATIENAVGMLALPIGIATNLSVNGADVLVPMAIEEPSVVAALSNGALLVRPTGGVQASADASEMIGQIQLYDLDDPESARERLLDATSQLLSNLNATMPGMVARGGGVRALEARILTTARGAMVVVHIVIDVRDAMGANVMNSACEALAPQVAAIAGGTLGVRVLTNLSDKRMAHATCRVQPNALARDRIPGDSVIDGILAAQALAEVDPYRAATHNKGIMNGIDAVALATGNDWRAIEAGAHAYAARDGRYGPLTRWERGANGDLLGSIELPLAVGTQGAATRAHPVAAVALKIMRVAGAQSLAGVMAAVGLVQNLAALRALVTEGIQQGHMRLHARQVALAAGATELEVDDLTARLIAGGRIAGAHATELLAEMRGR